MPLRSATGTLLLALLGSCGGSASDAGSASLTGVLGFAANAEFAVVPPSVSGDNNSFPGTVIVVLAAISSPPSGQDLSALACDSYYPAANGQPGPVEASQTLQVTAVPATGQMAAGETFLVVAPSDLDAGLATITLNADGGHLFADGGSLTVGAVPSSDAGSYGGSLTAMIAGQQLSGTFSAPYCASIEVD